MATRKKPVKKITPPATALKNRPGVVKTPPVEMAARPARRWGRWVAIGIVLVLVIGVIYALVAMRQYSRSPSFAVQKALFAARDHQLEEFDKHVDISRMAAYLVDDLLAQPGGKLGALTTSTQAELLNLLKPGLTKTIEDQLQAVVEKGPAAADKNNLVAELVNKLWTPEASFGSLETVADTATTALVRVTLHRADLKADLAVDVRLVKTSDRWELVGLNQLSTTLAQLDDLLAAERQAKNAAVAEQIKSKITLRDFQKALTGPTQDTLLLRAAFENIAGQNINGFAAEVRLFEASTKTLLGQFALSSEKPIPTAGYQEFAWPFKLDLTLPEHTQLAQLPLAMLTYEVVVYRLDLADGTTLTYAE